MKLYCANCGLPLHLTRKALPAFGAIVDLVDYHECAAEPIPFDLSKEVKFVPVEGKDKFVQSLNALEPPRALRTDAFGDAQKARGLMEPRRPIMTGTDDLRDRRFDAEKETTKSTAPSSIAEQIRLMTNSIPANDLKSIQEGDPADDSSSEMGG